MVAELRKHNELDIYYVMPLLGFGGDKTIEEMDNAGIYPISRQIVIRQKAKKDLELQINQKTSTANHCWVKSLNDRIA